MFSLSPPAWAYLAPLAHTSLPRKGTGKPHPVDIPGGGRRHFPAWAPASLPAVQWQVSSLLGPSAGVSSSASPLAAFVPLLEPNVGGQSFPPGAGQHPTPADRPSPEAGWHGASLGGPPPLVTDSLRHRVPVAILVGHVTMAGCKLRAQNHAPATEMYARRPSIGGSDDCAGSARPSSHTAPRRSGTP